MTTLRRAWLRLRVRWCTCDCHDRFGLYACLVGQPRHHDRACCARYSGTVNRGPWRFV